MDFVAVVDQVLALLRQRGRVTYSIAQRMQAPALLLEAHYAVGVTWFIMGNPALACRHLESTIALYDPAQHHVLTYRYASLDPGSAGLSVAAWALWLRGYPAQARAHMDQALRRTQHLAHPYPLARTLHYATLLGQLRREAATVRAQADAEITLAASQRFPLVQVSGRILRGWAIAVQEYSPEGLVQIREGLDTYRSIGAELHRPHFLSMLADASGVLGQPAEGLVALDEALALVEQTGECYYEAELHRQRGELLLLGLAQSPLPQDSRVQHEAEVCFAQALTVSRHQQAKSLELRAAMSLARLWQRRGQDAKALLEELA